jgi:hypothetical protein
LFLVFPVVFIFEVFRVIPLSSIHNTYPYHCICNFLVVCLLSSLV